MALDLILLQLCHVIAHGLELHGRAHEIHLVERGDEGIDKYSSINEHGKGVWVVSNVKKRIDELNYRTGRRVSIRAFTNAALEFVLDNYGDEIIEQFK